MSLDYIHYFVILTQWYVLSIYAGQWMGFREVIFNTFHQMELLQPMLNQPSIISLESSFFLVCFIIKVLQ